MLFTLWMNSGQNEHYLSLGFHNKYTDQGGFNTRHLFLAGMEAGEFPIRATADLVLGEGSPPSLQTATFSLSSHDRATNSTTRAHPH